jgi:short-subunit dehydrogenase
MNEDSLTRTNLFGVRGRNALITGATSGIGYMMAEGLIVNGIGTLFITGHRDDVQEKVLSLQKLADQSHFECKILGCVV